MLKFVEGTYVRGDGLCIGSPKLVVAETRNSNMQDSFTPPCTGARISLMTDASDTAIGAVLEQQVHGQWQPLAFFSR